MEVLPYVNFKIQAYKKGKRDETLKTLWAFEMPHSMYLHPATSDRLNWITARFKYFNPKLVITNSYSFYDKKTGLDMGIKSAISELSTAKGQVTKIENAIERDKKIFKPTLFLKSLEDTEEYNQVLEKLNRAKAKVFEAQCRVDDEMNKLTLSP